MKIARVILAVTVVLLSGYMLITGEYGVLPYTHSLLGIMFIIWGVAEFKENRKAMAVLVFLTGGFILFVSIYVLFSWQLQ
ncbi:MAG TPA: YczI family protein [Lentibacillus sp.]|uniref:YczI family protein n=1 Tax=Lentibacillus sp. TaxID=1925746 RepID=UPI002B4B6DD3|nr:YczI family protein [Lentibacillus sp.]HLR61954.1 YczI family protein [Lentibacillus sp.]